MDGDRRLEEEGRAHLEGVDEGVPLEEAGGAVVGEVEVHAVPGHKPSGTSTHLPSTSSCPQCSILVLVTTRVPEVANVHSSSLQGVTEEEATRR